VRAGVSVETYRIAAERRFLRTPPVIGIGVIFEDVEKLVFLLEKHSPEVERQVSEWASKRSIPITFQVTGPFPVV
jgi:hypothetical protein